MSFISLKRKWKLKNIEKLVYNRVHVNSIFMSNDEMYSSGGVGFSINYEPISIGVNYNKWEGNKFLGHSPARIESFLVYLNKKYNVPLDGWEIKVAMNLNPHIGLGSTTQIEAQIIHSVMEISCGKVPSYKDYLDNNIGCESGIGLKCFVKNGVHIDFGYQRTQIGGFQNSKNAVHDSLYLRLPENWKVLLIIPKNYTSLSGKAEEEFWSSILPVNSTDPKEISYYIMNMIPSVYERNFPFFLKSLKGITNFGSKPLEVDINNKYIGGLFREIETRFNFCGLSSLGPTCYTFLDLSGSRNFNEEIHELSTTFGDFSFNIAGIKYE